NLLNRSREITEKVIDFLHVVGEKKVRTYRKNARKEYLKVAQNRRPSRKTIRKGIGKQLRFLKRNFAYIEKALDTYSMIPLCFSQLKQYWVIQTIYDQQLKMYTNHTHSVDDRIVSIHQPHVRPIVRGKTKAKVEFGAKLHVSLVNGFAFLDKISWDAYNEGTELEKYVEYYKSRFSYYPEKVLVDKIYCTRKNRKWLKEKGIKLAAKPLGRPSAKAVENHVSPGERNPIEGKFGQAKNAYGLNRIRARLKDTSQTWIASIILVLNLVNLARQVPYCLSFS
ncbi:MAG: transposase, partial [Reichenbachiella sp.]